MHAFDWGAVLHRAVSGQLGAVLFGSFAEQVAGVLGGVGVAYVATPYSRESVDGDGLWSFEKSLVAARHAARELEALRIAGISAISPIVMAHAMIEATGKFQSIGHGAGVQFVPRIDPLDAGMWMRWCRPLIAASSCVVVPDLPGWDKSQGIKAEFRMAVDQRKPVFLYAGVK